MLELVSERVGDPTSHVYHRLFADHPELEPLFIRDEAGLVRGQTFHVRIESPLDFVGERRYGANLVRNERVNHQGLGVEPDVFAMSYVTAMAPLQENPGPE